MTQLPHSPATVAHAKTPPRQAPPGAPLGMVIFGVLLPATALSVELAFHVLAGSSLDPLPTPLHAFMVALVVVAAFLSWRVLVTGNTRFLRAARLLSAMGIMVSAFYALCFLPMLPFIVPFSLMVLGLLPASPYFALYYLVRASLRLQAMEGSPRQLLRPWKGLALGAILVLAADAPPAITHTLVAAAAQRSDAWAGRAVAALRWTGDEETLRSLCYWGRGRVGVAQAFSRMQWSVTPEDARRVYFQVTGVPFNTKEAAQSRVWWRERDDDIAEENVGGVQEGLHLQSSHLAGSLDANAAVAYLEWTLTFHTTEDVAQEARFRALLPDGAVVSRVVLMVNGEEREAAYAGTSQVRAAYQKVVQRSQDPLLVTWRSPSSVAVQCFPVTAQTPMTIKLGITVPMELLEGGGLAGLALPGIGERNFQIVEPLFNQVRLDSHQTFLPAPVLKTLERDADLNRVFGALSSQDAQDTWVLLERPQLPMRAWTEDLLHPNQRVEQHVVHQPGLTPDRLVVVLDGSRGMKTVPGRVAKMLRDVPAGTEVAVVLAKDGAQRILPPTPMDALVSSRLETLLDEVEPAGGQDNISALAAAMELRHPVGSTTILWVHAALPVMLSQPTGWKVVPHVQVVELPIQWGANVVAESLALQLPMSSRLHGPLESRFQRILKDWRDGAPRMERVQLTREQSNAAPAGVHTSSHLARLWAYEHVLHHTAETIPETQLAAAHRLVTPLSGAVVLVTAAQFDEAGLSPVDPSTVPSLPEPETWMLMGVAVAVVLLARRMAQ